jgi:uncharacterized protein (DUF2141 family)
MPNRLASECLCKFLTLSISAALIFGTCLEGRSSGADADAPATVTIKVSGLRNHQGDLIFGIFSSADGFPTEKARAVHWQVKPADADTVTFTAKLPPGKYGASVLHDENRNGKMDKNAVGFPLEGYGVTNNPKPRFRAATFAESRFDLPAAGVTLTIDIQYF